MKTKDIFIIRNPKELSSKFHVIIVGIQSCVVNKLLSPLRLSQFEVLRIIPSWAGLED